MNHWINGALATFQFELRKAVTLNRVMVALALAMFPPLIIDVSARNVFARGSAIAADVGQYIETAMVFLVALVCLLMLLLWATPNVHSELEGKTWNFLVVRPGGRIACFLGKFLTSVFLSFLTTAVSLGGSLVVINRYTQLEDGLYTFMALGGVYLLACVVYSAIFSLIGTIFLKRAMVVGAAFLIVVEVVLSALPAVVNKLAASYHLREIGLNWLGWFLPYPEETYRAEFGAAWPVWIHLTFILVTTCIALTAGMLVITNREFVTSEEG